MYRCCRSYVGVDFRLAHSDRIVATYQRPARTHPISPSHRLWRAPRRMQDAWAHAGMPHTRRMAARARWRTPRSAFESRHPRDGQRYSQQRRSVWLTRSHMVPAPSIHERHRAYISRAQNPYSAPLLHLCAGTYKYTPLPFYGTQACPLALAQTCMQHSTDPLSSPAPSLQVVSSSSSRARKGRLASCGLRLDRRWVWLDLQLHVNVSA